MAICCESAACRLGCRGRAVGLRGVGRVGGAGWASGRRFVDPQSVPDPESPVPKSACWASRQSRSSRRIFINRRVLASMARSTSHSSCKVWLFEPSDGASQGVALVLGFHQLVAQKDLVEFINFVTLAVQLVEQQLGGAVEPGVVAGRIVGKEIVFFPCRVAGWGPRLAGRQGPLRFCSSCWRRRDGNEAVIDMARAVLGGNPFAYWGFGSGRLVGVRLVGSDPLGGDGSGVKQGLSPF
jgi:hypothetical protein